MASGYGIFQNLYGLCVGEAYEFGIHYALQSFYQTIVIAVIQEFDIFVAIVKAYFTRLFIKSSKGPYCFQIVKGQFPGSIIQNSARCPGIGVFRPEGGTEGVDFAQGSGSELAFN